MNEINEIKLLKEEVKRIKSLLCCKDALFFNDFASFPVEGKVDILYMDKETSTIYIWNGSTYISIGGSASLQEDITYDALATAIGASELVPGLKYRWQWCSIFIRYYYRNYRTFNSYSN